MTKKKVVTRVATVSTRTAELVSRLPGQSTGSVRNGCAPRAKLVGDKYTGKSGDTQPLDPKNGKWVHSSSPAKDSFAGKGGADLAGESDENMGTPNVGNPSFTLDVGVLGVLSAGDVVRLRFEDEKEETDGLGLLLEDGHVVNCYENDVYGLTSRAQLESLERAGIKYALVS